MVGDEFDEAFWITEEERAAFIGGKPPSESDREHLVVEKAIGVAHFLRRFAVADALDADALANEFNRALLECLVQVPQNFVWDVDDSSPEIAICELVLPVSTEILRVKIVKLAG